MIRVKYPLVIIVLALLFNSCQYDNIEDLYPVVNECDISNISYAKQSLGDGTYRKLWPEIINRYPGKYITGNVVVFP